MSALTVVETDLACARAKTNETSPSVVAFVVVSLFFPKSDIQLLCWTVHDSTHTPLPDAIHYKDLHPSRAGEHIFTIDRARAPARASTPRLGAFAR